MRLRAALAGPELGGIAEIKRRSPSAGDLRPDADPARLAGAFEEGGAAAVSVIVDQRFGGSVDDLRAARAGTRLPILAKGFFRTEAEVAALHAAGADAVLLILRDLDDATAARLHATAAGLGMDALVEAHDGGELRRALRLPDSVIGVNARDLGTFRMDRRRQLDLVAAIPPDRIVVAESGILNRAHAAAAEVAGANAVLVGTALMRAADPGVAMADLLRRPLVKVCGLTREEDVATAAGAGVDVAGFVLAPSPRRVAEPLPVPDSMLSVGIVVGPGDDPGTDLVQRYARSADGGRGRNADLLRGRRRVARVLDLPRLAEDPDHWPRAARAAERGRVVLAGRLGPHNVRQAVHRVRPWCVDAARGLEVRPGVKDAACMGAFVKEAAS